jgi:hypothetical protein
MSTVTLGFFPREQFSLAAESLRRIFEYTRIPFNLIVIDCNTPNVYWQQMEQVLQGRSNVTVIHTDYYLQPNQSKNLLIQAAKDDFLCLIENDVLVEEGWLSQLVTACEEEPADVAVPRIIEGPVGTTTIHCDNNLGQVRAIPINDGLQWEILPATGDQQVDTGSHRRAIALTGEAHCQLYRRTVFAQVAPFDEAVIFLHHVDTSLALHRAKIPAVFEPKSVVHFWHPYPPHPDELDYFLMRWDLDQSAQSLDRIKQKWNLISLYGDLSFALERNHIGHLYEVRDKLNTLIPPQASFILVDEDRLKGNKIIEGLQTIPFAEHNGQYWGAPADDTTAIQEFGRLRQMGASAIVFLWHTFWWLEYYAEFHDYLRRNFTCTFNNDHLIVFDLCS